MKVNFTINLYTKGGNLIEKGIFIFLTQEDQTIVLKYNSIHGVQILALKLKNLIDVSTLSISLNTFTNIIFTNINDIDQTVSQLENTLAEIELLYDTQQYER